MKISSAFQSKYLKAADLPEGRDVFVKIDDVQMEVMETQGDEKPVLSFIGKKKTMVLNQTNANAISSVLGDDTEAWHGHSIALFTATTSYNGRTVPCLRVRVPRPAATQPAPAPAPTQAPPEQEMAGEDCPF